MTHPYITRGQAWVLALKSLLGYPLHEPTRHTMAFCASGPRSMESIVHVTQLAQEMQRDFLHLSFQSVDAPEPSLISLAVLLPVSVEWIDGCQLYAPSEKAPVELIQNGKRWRIDERNQLVSAKPPARHLLVRGEQIAWDRWRRMTNEMDGVGLDGNMFVPQGQPFSNALPVEAISVVG
ncbi:MAG: hypothetical protein ACSLE1_03315 [Sphingobium sp.]